MARDIFTDLQPLAHRSKKYNNDREVPQLVGTLKMYT
jgi:hypothetical protein